MVRSLVLLAGLTAAAGAQGQRPLEASLRRGVSEPSFYVNQPAYVAVFEVIPGQGVQQIFPRTTSQATTPMTPGEYLLSRPFRSPYSYYGWNNARPYARPMWMVDYRGRIVSYYYTTGWTGTEAGWGASSFAPTRTLLLVASRQPLRRVASPDAAQHWLQQVVGFRAISNTVTAPSAMLDDIVDAIVPLGSAEDDVVVDVLEVTDDLNGYNRYAGQSIAFFCPGGLYNVPAAYFFESGMFFCPVRPQYTDTPPAAPPTTVPADTVKTEQMQLPARKVPPKYQVDENAVPFRRGVIATPTTVDQPIEGYQPYRRGDGATEEGFKAYGRGVGTTDVGPRGAILVGIPVDPAALARGWPSPSAEAWVPPRTVRRVPTEQGGGRYNNGGAYVPSLGSGSESFRPATHAVGTTTSSTSTAVTAPSTSSADQAARSAASREAISAARPAATKPNPDPQP